VVAQTLSCACSVSKHRCEPGSACTFTLGSGRCQLIEHNTPSSGAANAISCQRDPINATASANAAQVAIARVNVDARQRKWASRISITSLRRLLRTAARSGNRQSPQQFLDDVGALNLSYPHLRPQGDPMRHSGGGQRLDVFGYYVIAAKQ
jgi:hypothetical protein